LDPYAPFVIRVALVDDVADVLTVLRVGFGVAGMEVVAEARDGETAVRCILESTPDVVVLDQRLPDFPGDEVFRQIRAEGCTSKVVLYSGWETRWCNAAQSPVADPFVLKGFDIDDLVAAARRVLDPSLS
jgi:DNA-binding NarL/FixJ family response regulator